MRNFAHFNKISVFLYLLPDTFSVCCCTCCLGDTTACNSCQAQSSAGAATCATDTLLDEKLSALFPDQYRANEFNSTTDIPAITIIPLSGIIGAESNNESLETKGITSTEYGGELP